MIIQNYKHDLTGGDTMDSSIQIEPTKTPSQTTNGNRPPENPYTLEINGTTVNIRFTGNESLNHRLAGAFNTMIG